MRFVVVLLLAVLAGCAQVQPISDANRKKITSVAIHPEVAKPPTIFYLGPGGSAGLMFGALGGALAAGSIEDSRKSFQAYVDKHGISIEKIVREEVEAAARKSGRMPLVDKAAPESSSLIVTIQQYGFSIPNGFSSRLVPILYIRCELKDSGGVLVWSASDRTMPLGNPVEAVEPEKIQNDPAAMEGAWRAAARHLAAELMKGY